MAAFINLAGMRFGKWLILSYDKACYWNCLCEGCGKTYLVYGSNIRRNLSRSCLTCARSGKAIHGMVNTKVYRAWAHIKNKHFNPLSRRSTRKHESVMHGPWVNSFEAFYKDVGEPTDPGYQLGLIDYNGNYEPGNVRWAPIKVNRAALRWAVREKGGYV